MSNRNAVGYVDVFARVFERVRPDIGDARALVVAERCLDAYVRSRAKGLRGFGGYFSVDEVDENVGQACLRLVEGVGSAVSEGVEEIGRGTEGASVCDAGVGGDGVESEFFEESVGVSVSDAPKVGKWKKKNIRRKENRRLKGAGMDVKLPVDACGAGVRSDNWRQSGVVGTPGRSEARETLEAKWIVENKLKAFEAERKLQLLKLQDVSEVAKLQERKIKAAGERAMVQIEKSHATLAATGNVPGVVPKGGYCTTIVEDPGLSDGSTPSCTISPDSSASMQEFRELQKGYSDLEKELADAKKLIRRREIMDKATYAQSMAEFTAGSESVMSDGLKCELDRKFGESYEYEGKFDGKHVVRKTFHDGGMNVEDGEFFGDVY